MAGNSVPHTGGKSQNNSQNFPGFSKKALSREDRLKGDLDFYTQIPNSLLHAPLHSGQVAMLAFIRGRCKGYGCCQRDKALRDFLAYYNAPTGEPKSKRHMTVNTATRYLREILKTGRVLEIKAVNDRIYLIADASPARMCEMLKRFRAELLEEAEYQDELRRTQAKKAAQDESAWAELLAYARRPGAPATAEETPEPAAKSFADDTENDADDAENNDAGPANLSRDDGKILQPNESDFGGESSPESASESAKETTTPGSALPCSVEESARQDGVVDVLADKRENEESQAAVPTGQGDDADAPFASLDGPAPASAPNDDNNWAPVDPFAADATGVNQQISPPVPKAQEQPQEAPQAAPASPTEALARASPAEVELDRLVRSLVEEFCDEQFSPTDLRDVLDIELDGARLVLS